MDDKRWANPHQGYVMTCGNDQQSNAAFIVRAVNCHQELLKLAYWVQDSFKKDEQPKGLKEVIAKAEGRL